MGGFQNPVQPRGKFWRRKLGAIRIGHPDQSGQGGRIPAVYNLFPDRNSRDERHLAALQFGRSLRVLLNIDRFKGDAP